MVRSVICMLLLGVLLEIPPLYGQFIPVIWGHAGYTAQEPVQLAPGQITMISVPNAKTRVPHPVRELIQAGRVPTESAGFRVNLLQGDNVAIPVGVLGVRQFGCTPDQPVCENPMTSITITVPFDMIVAPEEILPTRLEIFEKGASLGTVRVLPKVDEIHFLRSCDAVAVYLSSATEVPEDRCVPFVRRADTKIITEANPVRPGETVASWAYGLGAVSEARPGTFPTVRNPVALYFNWGTNLTGSRTGAPGTPVYAGAIAEWGLYQVNFTIPNPPGDLAPCQGIAKQSNLTVTIAGPTSIDYVRLCVVP